jgi:hypothetical protein
MVRGRRQRRWRWGEERKQRAGRAVRWFRAHKEYDVVPAPRQIKREMCSVMHEPLAFGSRSRIRENGRRAARESASFPFASTGALTARLTARIFAQSAISRTAVISRAEVRGQGERGHARYNWPHATGRGARAHGRRRRCARPRRLLRREDLRENWSRCEHHRALRREQLCLDVSRSSGAAGVSRRAAASTSWR